MTTCFFVSDLHGRRDRYEKLFQAILRESPEGVFLGGDLMPTAGCFTEKEESFDGDFLNDYLVPGFGRIRDSMGESYPHVFTMLGNDDPRALESDLLEAEKTGIWQYTHNRKLPWKHRAVYGYACVPPTPFLLKDWERYDLSRYVDPGCVSPEEGFRSIPVPDRETRYGTIKGDLESLVGGDDVVESVILFHTPPYQTKLDRADLEGKMVDHAPLDVHVGSIAVQRFIQTRQPLCTLHGHIHESARLTGAWRDRIGRTHLFSAAHDGPELSLVRFDLEDLERAERILI